MIAPIASPRGAAGVADGWLIGPLASAELSQSEVVIAVSQAVAQSDRTRAAIRLPLGSTARMVIAVSDLQGTTRGLFRMPDSTIFSIDVAVAKRSEEHTSELQSRPHLVCRLLLEKKKKYKVRRL